MRRTTSTILALCLCLAALPAHANGNDPDADGPDLRQADIAFAYEATDEAYAAFSMHFGKARGFYLVGDFTSAIKEFGRSYMLVRDPTALLNLAISYDMRAEVEVEKGEYRKARVDKRMALHLYKNAGKAKLSEADSALCGKRTVEVRQELGRLREIDPMLVALRRQQGR
jgi:tetratricopeptide (TPR) repeat protein